MLTFTRFSAQSDHSLAKVAEAPVEEQFRAPGGQPGLEFFIGTVFPFYDRGCCRIVRAQEASAENVVCDLVQKVDIAFLALPASRRAPGASQ